MSFDLILPWLLLAAAGGLTLAMDRRARRQCPDGDSGGYWTRVIRRYLFPMTVLLLLSTLLESLPVWPAGWHLHLDRVPGAPTLRFHAALLLPMAGWWLATEALLPGSSDPTGSIPRLAGTIGFNRTRRWLLAFTVPFLLIVGAKAGDLGGGMNAYPAALWSTLVAAFYSLAAIALGGPRPHPAMANPSVSATAAAEPPADWSEVLAAAGIRGRHLRDWPASDPPRPVQGPAALALARDLNARGARGIAPELIEAVATLLEPTGTRRDAMRPVFAPDDCGQAETVAAAAAWLDREEQAVTLVVAAGEAGTLAACLRKWVPPEDTDRVVVLEPGGAPPDALIWACDAEFLSDHLLPMLRDVGLVRRLGLVVWWDLHEYSGVMAANLWAIARRLYRLLDRLGRHDIRGLALIRTARPDAQLGRFIRHLLPQALPPATEVHVESRFALPLRLWQLENGSGGSAPGQQTLLLRAAAASVKRGWTPHLPAFEGPVGTDMVHFRQASAVGARLASTPAEARVRLLAPRPADVLSLVELLCQSGRAGPGGTQHVGLVMPANPYAAWLLERMAQGLELPGARRLIGAEANPAISRRHLLLTLSELPDTRRGLLQATRWDERRVDLTLTELRQAGQLTRRAVRYLNESGRLIREWEYQSRHPAPGLLSPLDTVGSRLVALREPAGDSEAGGVRLWIDPERVLVKAYPGRVFISQGRRYRVRDWDDLQNLLDRGWMECHKEDRSYQTWRIRNSEVYRARPLEGKTASAVGRAGRLVRQAMQVRYKEEIVGRSDHLDEAPPGTGIRKTHFERPIAQTFDTHALILKLAEPPAGASALPTLCQALRWVLPVHLGIDDDALELVTLNGERIDGEPVHGLAVVDLFPGGIGLIDAFHDDSRFVLDVLGWTRDWLRNRPGDDWRTPDTLATASDFSHDPAAAMKLLESLL